MKERHKTKDILILKELPSINVFSRENEVQINIPEKFINYKMGTIDLDGLSNYLKERDSDIEIIYTPRHKYEVLR